MNLIFFKINVKISNYFPRGRVWLRLIEVYYFFFVIVTTESLTCQKSLKSMSDEFNQEAIVFTYLNT